MSRGELIVEDNQVKSATTNADAWANEFQQQHPESWAAEFTAGEVRFTNIFAVRFDTSYLNTNFLELKTDVSFFLW